MKILYFDCFAGISGDMNLGALVDLGVPKEYLISELEKLNISGYKLEFTSELKMGISGTKASVRLEKNVWMPADHVGEHTYKHSHSHSPDHPHNHIHEDHLLSPAHTHDQVSQEEHIHRNLKDIQKIILDSKLNPFIKEKSLSMFEEIAIAEAKIHSKDINEIHFHEVGAIDSIVDIVGAAICIDFLKPDIILSSSVELGDGFVKCAHGIFPVPAPATAEILKSIPVKTGGADKETTTPTGAAILKVFVKEYTDQVNFSIARIAYGIGHYDFKIPNVLRVYLGEMKENFQQTSALLIECNIDDMSPEYYEYIMDKLFDAGAQDVYLVPVIMKKSRPAVTLHVLCDSSTKNNIEEIILKETTTLGLRTIPAIKSILERRSRIIDTIYGPIQIKESFFENKKLKYKAEYNDCIQAARKFNVSLKEIHEEVERAVKLTDK